MLAPPVVLLPIVLATSLGATALARPSYGKGYMYLACSRVQVTRTLHEAKHWSGPPCGLGGQSWSTSALRRCLGAPPGACWCAAAPCHSNFQRRARPTQTAPAATRPGKTEGAHPYRAGQKRPSPGKKKKIAASSPFPPPERPLQELRRPVTAVPTANYPPTSPGSSTALWRTLPTLLV